MPIFNSHNTHKTRSYIVENVLEGLDEAGEWYLDRQTLKLFYIPLPLELAAYKVYSICCRRCEADG